MAAVMKGLDTLVFTGGVGKNSPAIRTESCAGLGWAGVHLDEGANAEVTGRDADIGASGAPVETLVVHAREELVIASSLATWLRGKSTAPG